MSRVSISGGNEEFKCKEQLYALFYELTSEVKGKDIELEEDEYIKNICRIKLPQLINYIRDTIQILIKQQANHIKIKHQTSTASTLIDLEVYESILRHQEEQERRLIRRYFDQSTRREIIENRLADSLEIEKEFRVMKEKVKYEEGRFLSNERKENEIIIIRAENTILKKAILEFEETNDKRNKEIQKLKETIREQKKEIEQMQKDLKMISNININISNSANNSNNNNDNTAINMNNSKCSLCGCININKSPDKYAEIDFNQFKKFDMINVKSKKNHSSSKYNQLNRSTSHTHITFDQLTNKAPLTSKNTNLHNNSTNMLFDITQKESFGKFYNSRRNPAKKNKINPYCMKITKLPKNNQGNQSRCLIGSNNNNNNLHLKKEQLSSRIVDCCKKNSGLIVNKQNLNKSS